MFNNRLQNLAVTLDRAKYFLQHQPQQDMVPFRVMSELVHKGFDVETDVEALQVLHALREELKKDKYRHTPALIQAYMLESECWRCG